MKVSKIFAGMSALALAATMTVCASAAEAPEENKFYNATGTWTAEYTGDMLAKAAEDGGAQFGANEDGTYTFGCNIQVGHVTNAKVTLEVTSSKNNLFNGADADAVNSTYMYTVQPSWNADAPADKEKTVIKWTETEKKGATDMNEWVSGPTKFNGQWAQFIMTDDDLSAITIKATIVADADSTWEYHAIDPDAEENVYIVFNMFGAPNTETIKVDSTEINKQIEGEGGSDDGSSDDGSSDDGSSDDGSSDDGSSEDGSNGGSKSSNNEATGGGNGGSTAGGSDNGGSTAGSGSANTTTTNNNTGSSAGLALAGLALAGAAVIASKKR